MTAGRLAFVLVLVELGLVCAGCSSVPDITYGNATSTSSGGSSGGASGQPPPPPDWDCAAGKAPPPGTGICCGNRICLGCAQNDCARCEQERCAGTVSSLCCKKGNGQMQCKAHDGC